MSDEFNTVGTWSTTAAATDGGSITCRWLDDIEAYSLGVGKHVREIVAFHCRFEFGEPSEIGEKSASMRDIAAFGRRLEPVLAKTAVLRARHENLAACFNQIESLSHGARGAPLMESAIGAIIQWRELCQTENFGALIEAACDDSAQGINAILLEIERTQAEYWSIAELAAHRAGRELLNRCFWSGIRKVDEALIKLSMRVHQSGSKELNIARRVLNQTMDLITTDALRMELIDICEEFFPQLSLESERLLQQSTLDGLGRALASFCAEEQDGFWLSAAQLQHKIMQSRMGTNIFEKQHPEVCEIFAKRVAFGTELSRRWDNGRNLSICRTGCFQRLLTFLAPLRLRALRPSNQIEVRSWFAGERDRASRPNDRAAELPWQHKIVDALHVARDPSLAIAKIRNASRDYENHLDWAVVSKSASLADKQSGVLRLPRTWRDVGREPKSKSDGFDEYCKKIFDRYPRIRPALEHAVKHNGQVERTVRPRPPTLGEGCALLDANHLQGTLGTQYRDFVVSELRSMGLDDRALRIAVGTILIPMSPQWGGGCRGEWFSDAPHPREIYFVLNWLSWLSPRYAEIIGNFKIKDNLKP